MSAMSRRGLALAAVLSLLALPVWAQEAAPDAGPQPAGDEVLVSAGRLERRGNERVIAGEGTVVVRYKDMRLTADRAVYNEATQDIVADGNVVLDSGPDRLQGEHLELNLGTRVGFIERAQGFVQTYYFTGERIEKQGPDRYLVRKGTFTTCEGGQPDWSFHTTTAEVTVDEYLQAWNPSLHVQKVPVLYFPYAVFPVKRDRSTGLLIPGLNYTNRDGLVVRNAFYWAPRDNYDATIGLDYLQKTGWGANGEFRYLLAPRTQGVVNAYYLQDDSSSAGTSERWALSTRNSHELPLGLQLEAEAFFQSDRTFRANYGDTIEKRNDERTTASVYLKRSWSAWDFTLSGRHEVSLLTEQKTTLTRFPELTVDRTGTRLFDTDLLLRLDASGVGLRRENDKGGFSTNRLHLAPELTLPLSLGNVARILPSAAYDLTWYSEDLDGGETTRQVPTGRVTLEGPRLFRVWDLAGKGVEKLKHLVEPSIGYVYTPEVDQTNIPQFDSVDRVDAANQLEYSLTNTLFAKVVERRAPSAAKAAAVGVDAGEGQGAGGASGAPAAVDPAAEGEPVGAAPAGGPSAPLSSTKEMIWVKLTQSYSFAEEGEESGARPFSPVEWEARTAPGGGFELSWRGNLDVYGGGVGYHDVALSWAPTVDAILRGEWRTTQDSSQDFLDVGGEFTLGRWDLAGRSRYNLADQAFLENRVSVKYNSQCWDITLGYVDWPDLYEYTLLISLKGIGTVLKL